MNKKLGIFLYLVISSILNILFTALIIGTLFAIVYLILKLSGHDSYDAIGNSIFGCFTVGLVASFMIFSKLTTKFVNKHNLAEKFAPARKRKNNTGDEPKQTVIPQSAMEEDE